MIEFRNKETQLLSIRGTLPVIPENYSEHLRVARELFKLYNKLRLNEAADSVIKETVKFIPGLHPLYTVNLNEFSVVVMKKVYQNDYYKKYLLDILKHFPCGSYFRIAPYNFGTELICYKKDGERLSIELDNDASDDEERMQYCIASEIRGNYRKIKIDHE